jgi:hypothetical protein
MTNLSSIRRLPRPIFFDKCASVGLKICYPIAIFCSIYHLEDRRKNTLLPAESDDFEEKCIVFALFLQKNLQNKKFALPLHSQYSNGGFI